MRATWSALACAAALTAAGCGGSDSDADPNDKRAVALECLTEEKQLDARLEGEDAIVVGDGDGDSGPRIRFFLTSGEAEAEQFEGRGEGAEQIGNALLFTREGSEEILADVENCLDKL